MLIMAKKLRELRFRELMAVYEETNQTTAETEWPELPGDFAREMAEQSFYQFLKEVFFPTPGAVYCIWEEAGVYVSAFRLEPYKDGLLLSGLETRPDCRGLGYAPKLIQAVLKKPEIHRLYSHVDKQNRASLLAHEKCGFRKIADHAVYLDGSVSSRAYTLLYEKKNPAL